MENKEVLEELKQINELLKDIAETNEWIVDNTGDLMQYLTGKQDSLVKSNSINTFNLLSLIFGFIVGYCLIKSFFEGLKI